MACGLLFSSCRCYAPRCLYTTGTISSAGHVPLGWRLFWLFGCSVVGSSSFVYGMHMLCGHHQSYLIGNTDSVISTGSLIVPYHITIVHRPDDDSGTRTTYHLPPLHLSHGLTHRLPPATYSPTTYHHCVSVCECQIYFT